MLSQGAKICLHIDYEMHLEEGLEHPAIVRKLVKEWKLTPAEVEDIIREQEEFLTTWGKGEIV
jgi:hypothetical protein|tara:strand:+ start:266 stop:454 length:189 start_codon:yes stop_codon:yes gene_type:complete